MRQLKDLKTNLRIRSSLLIQNRSQSYGAGMFTAPNNNLYRISKTDLAVYNMLETITELTPSYTSSHFPGAGDLQLNFCCVSQVRNLS